MSNDAQNDRAGHGNGDGAATGQVLVYDDNGKYDTGQPPGSEPAHEEFFIGPQVQSLNKMEQFEEDYLKALDEKKERLDREADGG